MVTTKQETPAALQLELRAYYTQRQLPCANCQGPVYRIPDGWLCGKCFDFIPMEQAS